MRTAPNPHPALVAAGEELHPTALRAPTTMHTSALVIINLELGQLHIVHASMQHSQPIQGNVAPPLRLPNILNQR